MLLSRNFANLILRRIDDLERRTKRLEQIQLEYIVRITEINKEIFGSLKNTEAGKENLLTIEEIIEKYKREQEER